MKFFPNGGPPLAITKCAMATAVATGGLQWEVRWPPVGYPGLSARVGTFIQKVHISPQFIYYDPKFLVVDEKIKEFRVGHIDRCFLVGAFPLREKCPTIAVTVF